MAWAGDSDGAHGHARFGRWTAEVVRTAPVDPEAAAVAALSGGAPVGAMVDLDQFCRLCGGGMADGFAHNGRGTRVCLRHAGAAVWCRFCRALAVAGGRTPPLPRGLDLREGPVCPGCAVGAVTTTQAARALFAEVVAWLPSQGMALPAPLAVRVALADEATIEHHRPHEDPDTYGRVYFGVWTVRGRRVRGRAYKIFLLQGLPAGLLQSAAAHELGHAWLAAVGAHGLTRPEEEGFCELVSHRWLSSRGTDEAAFHAWEIERQPDTVYGDGFRRVAALTAAIGWPELVRSLREDKRLPMAGG